MSELKSLIGAMPKSELHIHIEGSLEPEMMLSLASRNGVAPPFGDVAEARAAYNFGRLQDFLDLYYRGMTALRTRRDFFDLTRAYLTRAANQNIRCAEIFFDPQGHLPRGVDWDEIIGGIDDAIQEAADAFGMRLRLIMCFLRHLDEADAERTLDLALSCRDRIIGVGIDSTEVGNPPRKFARVFRRAREAGFLTVAHAGEEGPPSYVWEAIDDLGAERIDHGNRALEDAELVRRLAKDKIPLTVCPLSNLRLGVVRDMREHPIKRMLDAGLHATVNSDDPAYFGGYLAENYLAVQEALNLSKEDIVALNRNGFTASFMPEDEKAELLSGFDQFLESGAPPN